MTHAVLALLLASTMAQAPVEEPPSERPSPELLSAGAAAAGFVGGALLAVPALFSVLPLGGPLVAAPIAIAILGAGAGFGGFLGALLQARLVPSLGAGGIALGTTVLGAGAGVGAAVLLTSSADVTTTFLAALAAGALGGLTGAAVGGGLGTWLVRPAERTEMTEQTEQTPMQRAPAASAAAPTPQAQTP